MAFSDNLLPWWDREIDEDTGETIRADVRAAAHGVWKWVCIEARKTLGDYGDAAEVLESSVKCISRYLNKKNVAPHSADPRGLLALACYRALHRSARRQWRIELVGGTSELAELLRSPDWRDGMDRHLFLERLASKLDIKSRGILRLRMAGYDWQEIAQMTHSAPTALRKSFWRDLRKAHLRLLRTSKVASSDEG
jgi:hypothetical protein